MNNQISLDFRLVSLFRDVKFMDTIKCNCRSLIL